MKKNLSYMIFLVLLTGCVSLKTKEQSHIIKAATDMTQDKELIVINIPSHGAIGDAIAINSGGGKNATILKKTIQTICKNKNGSILVMSKNPDLSKSVISGALENTNSKCVGIWIIYAGTNELNASVKSIVESAGFKYGFVNGFQ